MANLNITNLDFDGIKDNFKNYLKSQDKFKDFNFDGSSMSVFLDMLAYNTFYNSFYTNVIANEMFLDSASDRAAVVSRAKALGYTPDSASSSVAYIDLEAHILKQTGDPIPTSNSIVTINQYAEFSTSVQNSDYTFLSPSTISLQYTSNTATYWVYTKPNVKIIEGKKMSYSWKVQNEFDKYLIPNAGIDTSTLVIRVRETESSTANTAFEKANSILDIGSTDAVYWIYEDADEKFYIEFGNDVIGKKVNIGNVIDIEYIVSKGSASNGAKVFTVGNYQYANSNILEDTSLIITNSDYTLLTLSAISTAFTTNSLVRGLTSNTTSYVYSYDSNNAILKLFATSDNYIFGETIREETLVNGNTVYGANGSIVSIKSEISTSTGGTNIESINDIKFYAPKTFASQNRLVTANDFEGILKNEYPFLSSVVAWGGEEETPQQLGHIFIATKPASRETLDTWEKTHILQNIIGPRKMIGMLYHMVDADYVYIYPSINIKYNADISASVTQESIITDVTNTVSTFGATNCDKFKGSFYYSPFCTVIDSSNDYILGNDTTISMLKHFIPAINIAYTSSNKATLKYSNPFYPYSANGVDYIATSSTFTCNVAGVSIPGCTFNVSSTNKEILTVANSSATVIGNAGSIDYANGIIYISNVTVTTTSTVDSSNNSIIQLFVKPAGVDLVSTKQQILKIYPTYPITATPIRVQR